MEVRGKRRGEFRDGQIPCIWNRPFFWASSVAFQLAPEDRMPWAHSLWKPQQLAIVSLPYGDVHWEEPSLSSSVLNT